MTSQSPHVTAVLAAVDRLGLDPVPGARGWPHMGALICDAGLQARATYRTTVRPRILHLMAEWPDATTTSRFARRLADNDLGEVLRWRGPYKLRIIKDLTSTLLEHQVESPEDLRLGLQDPPNELSRALRRIKGVGDKTMDYLSILAGSTQHVAVDRHFRSFAHEAGLSQLNYADLSAAIVEAALVREWTPGDLDKAIWQHYSSN